MHVVPVYYTLIYIDKPTFIRIILIIRMLIYLSHIHIITMLTLLVIQKKTSVEPETPYKTIFVSLQGAYITAVA